ncbi:hypothetical protein E5335_07510 [Coriobacteriaceae bacterium]|nr:hypothetical protein E5335_07510 [Coriobacteriaceae bacterium]
MDQDIIRGYWPLYEDGAPVRIGDRIMGTFDPMTVESVTVYPNTTNVRSTPDVAGTRDHLHLSPGERVKRVGDAPEGVPCLGTGPDGDIGTCILEEDHQTWHIVIDGVRYGVGNYARRAIAEALDLTTSRKTLPSSIAWPEVDGEPVVPGDTLWDDEGFMINVTGVEFKGDGYCVLHVFNEHIRNVACTIDTTSKCFPTLTRTEPETVLDRDGVPIEVGDTVWHEADGTELHVIGFQHEEDGERIVTVERVRGPIDWDGCRCLSLSHVRPDSWERLAEDARNGLCDYWSCHDARCVDCPATVDGKDPAQRYGTDSCAHAMAVDIVARAKALAGVVGDE